MISAALKSRLIALNVHDAVMHLTEGSCDLLLAYHHDDHLLIRVQIDLLNHATFTLAENMMNTAVNNALKGTKI